MNDRTLSLDAPVSAKVNPRVLQMLICLVGFGSLITLLATVGIVFYSLRVMSSEVMAAVIAMAGTVIVGLWSVLAANSFQKRRDAEQKHRDMKLPVYSEFISLIFDMAKAPAPNSMEKKLEEFFSTFHQNLLLWGSPAVIHAYLSFRKFSHDSEGHAQSVHRVLLLAKLINAIRADLGHSKSGISDIDIVGVFLRPGELTKLSDAA